MSIGRQVNLAACYENYKGEAPEVREAIDAAFNHAKQVLGLRGFNTANDDCAEELVAAIWLYVDSSRT